MKLKKNVLCVMVLFGSIVFGVAMAAPSLCTPTQAVIFSCATSTSKTIALCMDERHRQITYRYGKPRRVEISYSASLGNENGIYANHYFRPGVDYMRVAFAAIGYEYSVFRNYYAAEAYTPKYGVVVSRNGNGEAQIECRPQVIDNMAKFIKNLKCDKSGALGCP